MERCILSRAGVMLVLDLDADQQLRLRHFGSEVDAADLPGTQDVPTPSSPDRPQSRLMLPQVAFGFTGQPSLSCFRDDLRGAFGLVAEGFEWSSVQVACRFRDEAGGLSLTLTLHLTDEGILCASSTLLNTGNDRVFVTGLAALNLPLDPVWACLNASFGTWSGEGRAVTLPLTAGFHQHRSAAGRPGFEGGPFLLLESDGATETAGQVMGLALATTAPFDLVAGRLMDGEVQVRIAPDLAPGEVVLEPGERWTTPEARVAFSDAGRNGMSARWHGHVRNIMPETRTVRPVQLNSWEAVYFNVSEAEAIRLAKGAAELGVERFVLDDGWFLKRSNDRSSLGDWIPDPDKFPNGLKPVSDACADLGIEFGLWMEPEMVSPDSDLYRAHPDWVLAADGIDRTTARNQLVLDFTQDAVRQHVFETVSGALRGGGISYVKWDCNRDLFPAASRGRSAAHAHLSGVMQVAGMLKARFPDIAFEACASGGGRMDLQSSAVFDRFWPSDATDAVERVRVQRRASLFWPPEVLGAHVGPETNPWTRQRHSMVMRGLTAFFGHFGVEADPDRLDADARRVLTDMIAVWKDYRAIIVHGQLQRLDSSERGVDAQMITSAGGDRVLLRILRTEEAERFRQSRLRLPGLAADARWRVLEHDFAFGRTADPLCEMSSRSLGGFGLDCLPAHRGQGRLFVLERVRD